MDLLYPVYLMSEIKLFVCLFVYLHSIFDQKGIVLTGKSYKLKMEKNETQQIFSLKYSSRTLKA